MVDDDELVIGAVRALLTSWQVRSAAASSASELDAYLRGAQEPPHFAIVDFQLAQAFTGEDAIRRIREHFGVAIPCAIITGNVALVPNHVAARERTYVLAKPVQPARLRALLRSVSH